MRRLTLIISLVLIFSIAALAVSDFEKALENAKIYYDQGDFTKSIEELKKAMDSLEGQNNEDKVEAYKYLGFSYVAFGEKEKAKEEFKKVIKLKPSMKLDATIVSPKIIAVFAEARAELEAEGFDFTKPVSIETIPTPQPRIPGQITKSGAFFRSLFIPGLGQIYKGQKTKGYVIMGSGVIFLGATLGAMGDYNDKKDAYESAAYNDDFEKLFKDYEDAASKASAMATITGVIWMYNIIDASFFSFGPSTNLKVNPDFGKPGLKLQIKF